ncbi:hypothetical protein ABEB36_002459 [Hypothenemus hampei]|uniref:Uncharacterized protein n=1 Tax=Hypothenemus hampei TaxID=57062 RepID=A0ABD1F5T8_HYPHA
MCYARQYWNMNMKKKSSKKIVKSNCSSKNMKKSMKKKIVEKDCELELFKQKYENKIENLENDIKVANWEVFKQFRCIQIRSFLDLFDAKCLECKITERKVRFAQIAKSRLCELKEWGLTLEFFVENIMKFYHRMCDSAHPSFDIGTSFIIPENNLKSHEWRILAFLWEQYPLPLENLKMEKSENDIISALDFDKTIQVPTRVKL